jgi:hypothetical protein
MKLPATISYGEEVFRPAGYRIPAIGEQYVGQDGHIKSRKASDATPAGRCLIVRVFNAEADFKGTQR